MGKLTFFAPPPKRCGYVCIPLQLLYIQAPNSVTVLKCANERRLGHARQALWTRCHDVIEVPSGNDLRLNASKCMNVTILFRSYDVMPNVAAFNGFVWTFECKNLVVTLDRRMAWSNHFEMEPNSDANASFIVSQFQLDTWWLLLMFWYIYIFKLFDRWFPDPLIP